MAMAMTGTRMPVDLGRRLPAVLIAMACGGWAGAAQGAEQPQYDFTATSSTITILFDADGTLMKISTGKNAAVNGAPLPTGGVDQPPPPVSVQPPQFSVKAKEGIVMELGPKLPGSSELTGGFTVDYGEALLTGERLNLAQSLFPGTPVVVADHGVIAGGPEAPKPGRVRFDSTASELARFSFRGTIESALVNLDRREAAPSATAPAVAMPAAPPVAHYHVTLADVGDFAGKLRSHQGWADYTGWSDHADVDLAADVTAKGLANLRLEQVTLYGSQTPDGHPRRLAEVHRPQLAMKAGGH
jgi:hypothetical protein